MNLEKSVSHKRENGVGGKKRTVVYLICGSRFDDKNLSSVTTTRIPSC